jgi:predicted DNA-binding transcriptional regulator AlpA
MTTKPPTILPDDRVISEHEAAKACGISVATLRRHVAAGVGPRRIRLSAKRVGYRLRHITDWLDARTEGAERTVKPATAASKRQRRSL